MEKIPVYPVSVPEYNLKIHRPDSETIDYPGTPWYTIKIPKVYWENQPDFEKIGSKIDQSLMKHFQGKNVAIRALSSAEHKGKSSSDMIKIIKELGHDRYDLNRKGDRYENIENRHIDFFALDFKIEKDKSYFKYLLEPFYFWPIADRGNPIRIDIAIVYDLSKLSAVEHRYEGRENEIKKDGFVFKDPDNKPDAILGILKIL